MANALFKEEFTEKYNGVTPSTMLKPGAISAGKNVRKVSVSGGWKCRKGSALHNTTAAESGSSIKSLHMYKHPRNSDYHFLAQINSKLLDSSSDPPTAGTTFGSDLGVSVGTTPGFSTVVGEDFYYADGSGVPIVYGGATPFPIGFVVWDNSETSYNDYSRLVRDNRSTSYAVVLTAASDVYYVLSAERISAITLTFSGTLNSTAASCTVSAWRSGAWTAVSGQSDGTASGGATHAQSGTISWTASGSDSMKIISGIMGYVYRVSFSTALSGSLNVTAVTVTQAAAAMTNKWGGTWEWVGGCRFYDQSAGQYIEQLGKISNESTSQYMDISSATTSDFIYVKVFEAAAAFGIGVVDGYGNTADAQIDNLEYWDGDSWNATTSLSDETLDGAGDSSFAQTGTFMFDATTITPAKRTFEGDDIPGYWYRFSWDAALSTNTRVYMIVYAAYPEVLAGYKGVIEHKNRLILWGDPEFPNRLRFSMEGKGSTFCGADSGYTDPFGDMSEVQAVASFYNELLIWKPTEVWLMEGYNKQTFGNLKISDTVGLASPKTAVVVEVGFPGMSNQEPTSIAIWQDVDGVYVLDGRKPKKVSGPVDHYFNTEFSTCIPAAYINQLQAYVDKLNNEYHLLSPDGTELVYNFVTDEWYPPFSRALAINTGLMLKGTDNRLYGYGGTSGGFMLQLESDTTDKSAANADVAIDHYVTTRSIALQQDKSTTMRFTFLGLWTELKARTVGSISPIFYKNMATSGVTLTALSMISSGFAIATPNVKYTSENCTCFQIKFPLNVADQELEIWSFMYELDAVGLIGR